MTQQKNPAPLSRAAVAKLIKRRLPKTDANGQTVLDETGRPVMQSVPVKAGEVLAWQDYGDYVMVVTTDGQKYRGEKTA